MFLQRTRTIHCPVDFTDIHKVCPYDLYDIFAHAKGPIATVGTYFMYVRKLGTNGLLRKKSTQNRTIKIFQKWLLPTNCFDNKDFPQYFLIFDFPIDFLRSNYKLRATEGCSYNAHGPFISLLTLRTYIKYVPTTYMTFLHTPKGLLQL